MPGRRGDWALIVVAVAVRVAAVIVLQSHIIPHSTYEHGEIAENLLAGRGFSVKFLGVDGPTSQQAPLYPLLVAAAYAWGGVGTPRALLALELGQSLLAGLMVAAVLKLAREVMPDRPRRGAWVAGAIVALQPTLVYAATHVQVALPAATLLTATLAWAYQSGRRGRRRDAIATGLGLGLLILTDPILGLASVGVAGAIVHGQTWRRSPRMLATVAATAALVVAPWIVRNYRVHGEFVAVKSTFGYAFWQGNCALSQGTDKVVRPSVETALAQTEDQAAPGIWRSLRRLNSALWAARHEAGYIDDIALSAQDRQELGTLSEPERSRRLMRRALLDIGRDPIRYARLCLRRLRYFVFFDETNPKTRNLAYRSGHLALTAAALLGWILARPDVRCRMRPMLATAAVIALFHTVTITSARFHIPIEPLLAIWAAAGTTRTRNVSMVTAPLQTMARAQAAPCLSRL